MEILCSVYPKSYCFISVNIIRFDQSIIFLPYQTPFGFGSISKSNNENCFGCCQFWTFNRKISTHTHAHTHINVQWTIFKTSIIALVVACFLSMNSIFFFFVFSFFFYKSNNHPEAVVDKAKKKRERSRKYCSDKERREYYTLFRTTNDEKMKKRFARKTSLLTREEASKRTTERMRQRVCEQFK